MRYSWAKKTGVKNGGSVLVVGGLANVQKLWKPSFEQALKIFYPDATVEVKNMDLVYVALNYIENTTEWEEI